MWRSRARQGRAVAQGITLSAGGAPGDGVERICIEDEDGRPVFFSPQHNGPVVLLGTSEKRPWPTAMCLCELPKGADRFSLLSPRGGWRRWGMTFGSHESRESVDKENTLRNFLRIGQRGNVPATETSEAEGSPVPSSDGALPIHGGPCLQKAERDSDARP